MSDSPRISDSELEVMKILWEKAPLTSLEIVKALRSTWSPTTIYTLLTRLVNKKAVMIEEGSSPYVCKPLLSQQEYRRDSRRSFLKKAYNGSLNLMLINILEEEELSETEIDELKRILNGSRKKER
ncbi:penicillinase repressor [Peptococcaceae bacterium CEB3]|nr:penicillinase repressor [Peptococcaceae bacterium CEB3]